MKPLRPSLRGAAERVVGPALAGGTLVAVIAAAYALVVLALGRPPDAGERTVLALSAAATAAVPPLSPLARRRAAAAAQRLLQAQGSAVDAPLRLFASRLSRALPLDELLLQTAESLRRSLVLRAAEIWTGTAGELVRHVSDPEREPTRLSLGTEQPIVAREGVAGAGFAKLWLAPLLAGREGALLRIAPAVRSGELLGLIVAERAPDGEPFSEREDEVLAELGRQVALALHNARLDSALQASLEELRRQADELRASRARVVEAGDEARRRLERDLHDGAQQRLIALSMRLGMARQLVESDPERAPAALDELDDELKAAIDEVRELARGIYPAALAERGLRTALATAAGRSPLRATVAADDVGRYPREVEAAVYFCCLEALQNAARHAGRDASVTVRLSEHSGTLLFEVADDGSGFDPAQPGRSGGLANMADRLGALGGALRVRSRQGGGTTVSGRVPLSRDRYDSPPSAAR